MFFSTFTDTCGVDIISEINIILFNLKKRFCLGIDF